MPSKYYCTYVNLRNLIRINLSTLKLLPLLQLLEKQSLGSRIKHVQMKYDNSQNVNIAVSSIPEVDTDNANDF